MERQLTSSGSPWGRATLHDPGRRDAGEFWDRTPCTLHRMPARFSDTTRYGTIILRGNNALIGGRGVHWPSGCYGPTGWETLARVVR